MAVATFSYVRVGRHERDGRYRFALLFATLLVFAIYKLWAIGLDHVGELLLSYVFDASVWIGAWLLGELIAMNHTRLAERAAACVFYPVLYLSGALVFAHTFFYDAAIERRLTALDVTPGGVFAFFAEALPLRGYVALLLLLLGMHLFGFLASIVLLRPRLYQALLFALPILGAAAAGSALAPRTPSVLYDTGKELWDLATLARVVPAAFARAGALLGQLDKSELAPSASAPRFDKVVVLVMETMTAERLARESEALPSASFLRAQSAHLHRYARYFPNNQDSRTGMLDMLTSRLIPYEAYSDEGVEGYERLARVPSLADRFRGFGYRSAFAVSQVQLEDVVGDLAWDERLHLTAPEIAAAKPQFLCFEPDEYENACEDLVLLPKVVDFLAKHERAFVYQEFIWGHSYEYNAASGKTNTAYYAAYVDALLHALLERGLSERTLLVLTSDHGFRDKSLQHQLSVVQIPLMFYAPGFSAHDDGHLYSHVDFQALLFSELTGAALSTPNDLVMVVGPTGSGMVSAISAQGDFTLLRQRGALRLLSAQHRASQEALTPDQLLYLFQRYRAAFDDKLRSAR